MTKKTIGCLITSLCLLVVSLVLGTHLYFAYSSLTDVLLVFIPVILGTGLIIKSTFERYKKGSKVETKPRMRLLLLQHILSSVMAST